LHECIKCGELVTEDDSRECYFCGGWQCYSCAPSTYYSERYPKCQNCIDEEAEADNEAAEREAAYAGFTAQ
jgi:hypothetical protein